MESSSTAAAWLSFAVTAVGLGSLISQASVINDKMDPFHETRTMQHLGIWFTRQPQFPFWKVAKPPPIGPEINAKLSDGFCGLNKVYLSRVPVAQPAGNAGWATLLAVIHQEPMETPSPSKSDAELEKGLLPKNVERELTSRGWESLPTAPLVRHRKSACTTISRTTLLTLLSLTNARPVFRHSDAAGHRAAYASYTGQWYIDWPLGSPATVHFAAHDSHSAATDVYPPSFERRVDKCIQMTAGVIATSGFKVAFPGRKPPGRYVLKHIPKGFPGAHGSRHLYNMMGGKVYEIDFLLAQRLGDHDKEPLEAIKLSLPSTLDGVGVEMFVPTSEQAILAQAMDCLPWSPLSWSIHRGLRDILTAFSRVRMDGFRSQFASTLRQAVLDDPFAFDAMGWEPTFVRQHMGDMAAGAVVAGSGNSGDLVRVVTDVAIALCTSSDLKDLDETTFWRSSAGEFQGLGQQAIVALTKCFTVEWSIDFDYQMYHDLPLKLYFA